LRVRGWKATHDAAKKQKPRLEVAWNPEIQRALPEDWRRFIRAPDLLAWLAELRVPVTFLHMSADILPLLLQGKWRESSGAPHNAWLTHAAELGTVLREILRP